MTSPKKINRRPVGVDLFAGAGGMSLGFEQAGFDIAAAIEIDPIHCATHEFNFPHTATICASVVDVSGNDIRQRAGLENTDIDVVFGGAPCQGFSLIGKRALDDPRNQLVFHFVRLIDELRPKYFVFENVKGLTLGKHADFLHELISALEERGYDCLLPYRVLNAADYGVPQDRRRLFLIGARRGLELPRYPEASKTAATVADAITDLPNADTFVELYTSDAVRAVWETHAPYARRLRGLDRDPCDLAYRREFDSDLLTSSLRTEHTELSKSRFLATEPGKTEPVSRFRKLPADGLCNTLRAGTDSARGAFTSPRPIHPTLPRVITVREAARLHSYPDWFRLHSTKWHGFRQVGNSVPPLLARAVASEIACALGVAPSRPHEVVELGSEDLLYLDMGEAARRFRVPRNVIAQRLRKKDPNQPDLLEEAHVQS
jgi:DNA (cytosine-5)-methyltransferase 1